MISLNAEMTVESNRLGNKAKNLILLKKHGFHVPDGVVIDTDLYERAMLSTGLKKKLAVCFKSWTEQIYEKSAKKWNSCFLKWIFQKNCLKK